MKKLLWTAVAVAFSSLNIWAEPVDFTFEVPIKLNKVHSSDAEVMCKVFNAQGELIAGKWDRFDLNSDGQNTHSYDGIITIKMAAHSGKDPRDADRYECQIKLLYPWMNPPWQEPKLTPESVYLSPQPGSVFTPMVSGTIPKAPAVKVRTINPAIKPYNLR